MNNQHFVSPEGLEKIKEEYNHRTKTLRKEISEKIGVAKEQGDLSENFEYHAAKEMQGQNEARIHELNDLLKNAVIVEAREGESTINLGTKFVAADANGNERPYELVGATETDPMTGKISNESPFGKAFLGKEVGTDVEIKTPSGITTYKVISIT